MNISISDRVNVLKMDPIENHVFISISDMNSDDLAIKQNDKCKDILYLKFLDVNKELDTESGFYYLDAFSLCQAIDILNFVNKYKSSIDSIIIQCVSGISRSSGMGAALDVIFNNVDDSKILHDLNYVPNMFVYETLINTWNILFAINNGIFIGNNIVDNLRDFLGANGIKYFKTLKDEFGIVYPVIPPYHELNSSSIPYSVHFRDGMQIRNFLRDNLNYFNELDSNIMDSLWISIVELAIDI